jgi:hypothetical protein
LVPHEAVQHHRHIQQYDYRHQRRCHRETGGKIDGISPRPSDQQSDSQHESIALRGIRMHRGFTRKLGLEAVVLCSLITGCSAGNGYSGDGRMIDNGPSAATDRYVIDLGPIA